MDPESKRLIIPSTAKSKIPDLKLALSRVDSSAHLDAIKKADSREASMYHLIAAWDGEHVAQDIARLLNWKISSASPDQDH